LTLKGDARRNYQRAYMARRRAAVKAHAKPTEAPAQQQTDVAALKDRIRVLEADLARERAAQKANPPPLPRTVEEMLAAKRTHQEALKAKRAAARAAASETPAEDEATLQEKLHHAEKLLAVNKTRIKNLVAEVRFLSAWAPPRISRRLHRQVLGFLHPDRAHKDDAMRKRLERCFQQFSVIKFTFPPDDEQ
jgi:hypothetical protein